MKDIKNYAQALEYLANKDSDELFLNKGADHAIEVLKNIFNRSKNEILIFAGNHKGDVTNSQEYTSAIENYLQQGKKLKLILENKVDLDSISYKAYKIICSYQKTHPNQVEIKFANDTFIANVKKYFKDKIFHFAVGDNKRFRLEVSPLDYKAICSFNHVFAQKLSLFFNEQFALLD